MLKEDKYDAVINAIIAVRLDSSLTERERKKKIEELHFDLRLLQLEERVLRSFE